MSNSMNTRTYMSNLRADYSHEYQGFNNNQPDRNHSHPSSPSTPGCTLTRQSSRSTTENVQQTESVVNQLKNSIQNKRNEQKIDESFIERELSEIISQQCNLDRQRRDLPEEFKECSDNVLKQALVFGRDCRNFDVILKEKIQKEALSPKPLFPNREVVENLKRTFQSPSTCNLFQAVLKIKGDEINRAVRMFYSEAQRSVPGLESYKIEHAHEQVQAIRLTHYQSDDKRELHDLIQSYRTFDEAYSYLQDLVTKGTTDGEEVTSSALNSTFDRRQPAPPAPREHDYGGTKVRHPNATYDSSIKTTSV